MPYEGYRDDLDNFMEAIRVAESRGTGGYQAVGVETKHGRALGAYGIMEDFWDDWAEGAGIPGANWRDPAAQDRVARYRMTKLYEQYGSWDAVAAAWIGGEGGAQDYLAGGEGESDALGTNVKEYVERINGLFSPSGESEGFSYLGGDRGLSSPTQSLSTPDPVDTRSNSTPLSQYQKDERLVNSVLEHLADIKAGGERVSPDGAGLLPAGEKEEADAETQVEAAGEDIQAAPHPPAEPTSGGLNPSFESALEQMMSDAPGQVSVTSGYRSVSRQKKLWNDALAKYGDPEVADNWVARPGDSFHNHGLAADLDYDSEATKQWVHDNAAKYGLHFPLSNEDWHVEPVGTR